MKKFALIAAASAAFALTGCGSADDASEDAQADTVEMPADEALAGTPDPAADLNAASDAASDAVDENTVPENAADAAVQAAADAEAAADAAVAAAPSAAAN